MVLKIGVKWPVIMRNLKVSFALLVLISFSAMFSGCLSNTGKTPFAKVKTTSGTEFNQKGDVETPAKVEAVKTTSEIQLPAKTEIEIIRSTPSEPERVKLSLPEKSVMTTVSTVEHITGPLSAKPPSAVEIAEGNAVLWAFVASGVLVLGGLILVYIQHYKAAGIAFIGSFLVPTLAKFYANDKALLVCVGFVCVSLTLVAAWYLITKKFDLFPKAKR